MPINCILFHPIHIYIFFISIIINLKIFLFAKELGIYHINTVLLCLEFREVKNTADKLILINV